MNSEKIARFFYTMLKGFGWPEYAALMGNLIINLVILIALAIIINRILKNMLKRFMIKIAAKTVTKFDDYLYRNNTISHFTHLLTLFLIKWFLPIVLVDFTYLKDEVSITVDILTIIMFIWFIRSVLLAFKDFLKTLRSFKNKPIESYIQVFMIFLWFFGFILIFSLLTGKDIWHLLVSLGAISAVIILIFKDSILGFVASIQVSVNDTVRIGDWITMEKYGADGDVIEINLSSVKVRNFDNTITTIPTYYLISDSFKNWRGMTASGGRRIKRSILIKASSIRYVSTNEVEDLKKIQLITTYLTDRQNDIDQYNQSNQIDKSLLLNGRNMTNFGIFRKYVDSYLNNHAAINKDMIIMCRQLDPTSQGIPLEIYAFSRDKVWKNYEHIIADIFDHLLAATPYFDLEIYERPTGKDFLK